MVYSLLLLASLLSLVAASSVWMALRRLRAIRRTGPEAFRGDGSKGPAFLEDRTVGSMWG